MSDILSGDRIDESTSGPIPSKEDDRKRDIIAEQREHQRQDAIGGTEEPPKPRPAEQIPEPPQVAPPLPVIPAFDFSIAGSALEETREIARQTFFDVIKNVNINGQGPSIEGSTISFNIPQQPPASEIFLFQGVAIPQSQIPQIIQPPTIPQPQISQLEPVQEIQSIVVAPPARTPPPQVEQPQIETPPTISIAPPQERVEQPRITTSPSISVTVPQEEAEQQQDLEPQPVRSVSVQAPQVEAPELEEPQVPFVSSTQQQPVRLEISEPETTPSIPEAPEQTPPQESGRVVPIQTVDILQPEEPVEQPRIVTTPSTSVAEPQEDRQQQRGEPINEQRDRENTEREARNQAIRTSIGLDAVSPLDRPSETVTPRGEPINEQRDRENAERAQRDREVRQSAGLSGEDPMDEESDSAKAYKAAEAKSREKRESDPDFDRESDVRQRGERPSEFRERQERLKEEREERAQAAKEKVDFFRRVRDGDLTEAPSGIVPVEFTRADGQRKILAFVATEFVATTEGAVAGERTTSLPATNSYFLGGGGGECVGLALYNKTENDLSQVWVSAGTINGLLPSGFSQQEGKLIASGGSGDVWVEVNINGETGEIVSTAVDGGASTPENTETAYYYTLGYYEYSGNPPSPIITNYGCGSISVVVCRNWYAAEPPFYDVRFFR
jgi:hypothetical protein